MIKTKSIGILVLLVLGVISLAFMAGCGTGTGSSTTPTTIPSTHSISGTVSWTWGSNSFGTLWVGAHTDPSFTAEAGWVQTVINISTGEGASKNFTLSGLGDGTYYVMGCLYMDRWLTEMEWPTAGDKVGEYSDGSVPPSLSGTGSPEAIIISGANATDVDFSLNLTSP